MHTPQPRRHRKAGSGPAADALIAWIGADPYLREAATVAIWRRVATASPLCRTCFVRAAVVACCVLTVGAVLSMITLSDEPSVAQHKIASPPPVGHSSGAGSGPTLSLTVSAHGGSPPVLSIPAPLVPRLVIPAAPSTSTAPVVDQRTVPVVAGNQHNLPISARPRPTGVVAANKPRGLGEPSQQITVDPPEKTGPPANLGDGD
jgi:hypothetical protein